MVDELIDELYSVVFFSKLDLRLGYHQILLNPEDRHKIAFRTHHGHYGGLLCLLDSQMCLPHSRV